MIWATKECPVRIGAASTTADVDAGSTPTTPHTTLTTRRPDTLLSHHSGTVTARAGTRCRPRSSLSPLRVAMRTAPSRTAGARRSSRRTPTPPACLRLCPRRTRLSSTSPRWLRNLYSSLPLPFPLSQLSFRLSPITQDTQGGMVCTARTGRRSSRNAIINSTPTHNLSASVSGENNSGPPVLTCTTLVASRERVWMRGESLTRRPTTHPQPQPLPENPVKPLSTLTFHQSVMTSKSFRNG